MLVGFFSRKILTAAALAVGAGIASGVPMLLLDAEQGLGPLVGMCFFWPSLCVGAVMAGWALRRVLEKGKRRN